MIAGQRWSAATRWERIALPSGLFPSAMVASRVSQFCAAGGQPGDGEQEVRRLRWIGLVDNGLGGALGQDETSVAAFPAVELPVEKDTTGPLAREPRQVVVQARQKSCGAVQLRRSRWGILAVRRHRSSRLHVCAEMMTTIRS